jgi:hypothetical protein
MTRMRAEPIRRDEFDELRWLPALRSRVVLDPELTTHYARNSTIYRYASLTEATCLLGQGRLQLKRPSAWRDPYEKHVGKRLFGKPGPFAAIAAYAKCFSLEPQSEAMWRLYASSDGLVRLSFGLRDLIDALDAATHSSEPRPKLYVGRARYMPQPSIRRSVERIAIGPTKSVSRVAMQAILMKRSGFVFEDEVRACFLYKQLRKDTQLTPPETREISQVSSDVVTSVLLDPYATKSLARTWKQRLVDGCKVTCKVEQSKFDLSPDSL